MDPLSQAVLGSSLSQSFASRKNQRWAFVAGALGGLAPDLDILISSRADPLLFLEYHRQLTHSLVFIPVGGLLVTAILIGVLRAWALLKRKLGSGTTPHPVPGLKFLLLYTFVTLGYATHGLLDACTSYGTLLYWPFSYERVAWNNIGIIDPIPTLTLIVLVLVATIFRAPRAALAGLVFFVSYLVLGVWQRERVSSLQAQVISSRGHESSRSTVKPTIGNLIVWRSIYLADGRYHIDAFHAPLWGETKFYEGESVPAAQPDRDFNDLPRGSRQRRDIERFYRFSESYIARVPDNPMLVTDVRYSLYPNGIKPLWAIRLDPARPDEHVHFETFRRVDDDSRRVFIEMVLGR